MYKTQLVVKNETGLHARPASDLTNLCQKFESEIAFVTENATVNPKSIISLLSEDFQKGLSLPFRQRGPMRMRQASRSHSILTDSENKMTV